MVDCHTAKIDAVAMRLLLLRHAKSEKGEPGMIDRDRTLNDRGRKDAPRIGEYIVHHALQPDRALVSGARRTRETWERLATVLPAAPPVSYVEALYNAGPEGILDVIKGGPRSARCLLVIGHNPGLHDAARLLIAAGDVDARERLSEGLPTAGLVVIDFAQDSWQKLHPRSGRLERFVTPRSLRAAAD
jgi:phosphohistidine phosphatase